MNAPLVVHTFDGSSLVTVLGAMAWKTSCTSRMLVVVQKYRRSLIVVGLGLFPFTWVLLLIGQGVYFGPMRSAFEKIGRRYFDDLPHGWGVFDVLFYALPLFGMAMVVVGVSVGEEQSRRFAYLYCFVGVIVVVGVRAWAPGYL